VIDSVMHAHNTRVFVNVVQEGNNKGREVTSQNSSSSSLPPAGVLCLACIYYGDVINSS